MSKISEEEARKYLAELTLELKAHNAKNLTGQRFGYGIVIKPIFRKYNKNHADSRLWYLLRCDCGNYYIAPSNNLKKHKTKSCGCYALETRSNNGKNSKYRIKGGKAHRVPKAGNSLAEKLLISIELWDYEKNNGLTPYDVNSSSKIPKRWFKCENNHTSYLCSPDNFYRGRRCPICKESKLEQETRKTLDKLNIKYEKEYDKFNIIGLGGGLLRFDFFLPGYNLLIECQGEQHYGKHTGYFEKSFKTTQKHDQIKRDFCQKHNIKLLEIPYTEYNKIEEILKKELNLWLNMKT